MVLGCKGSYNARGNHCDPRPQLLQAELVWWMRNVAGSYVFDVNQLLIFFRMWIYEHFWNLLDTHLWFMVIDTNISYVCIYLLYLSTHNQSIPFARVASIQFCFRDTSVPTFRQEGFNSIEVTYWGGGGDLTPQDASIKKELYLQGGSLLVINGVKTPRNGLVIGQLGLKKPL